MYLSHLSLPISTNFLRSKPSWVIYGCVCVGAPSQQCTRLERSPAARNMLSRSFVRMLSRGRRRHYKWRSMYCESKLLCFIILVQLQPAAKLASEAVRKNSYSFCYVLYCINLTIVRLVCGLDCIHLYDRECIVAIHDYTWQTFSCCDNCIVFTFQSKTHKHCVSDGGL